MRKDDSAQLILIAGFTIGIAIVISTIMLNNIIYASNMASESSADASHLETSNIIQTTSQATSAAYQSASNYSPFNTTAFNEYMTSYDEMASRTYALSGTSFSVENSAFFDAYFTQSGLKGGKPNWTVVENVNTVNEFEIYVSDISKLSGSEADAFKIQAMNQTDSILWTLKLYKDDDNDIKIKVDSSETEIENIAGINLDILNDNPVIFHYEASTYGDVYDLKFTEGDNAMGKITISGSLVNNESFTWKRYEMMNATVSISSNDMKASMSIPISLP